MNRGNVRLHDVYEIMPGLLPEHVCTGLVSGPGVPRTMIWVPEDPMAVHNLQILIDQIYDSGVYSQRKNIIQAYHMGWDHNNYYHCCGARVDDLEKAFKDEFKFFSTYWTEDIKKSIERSVSIEKTHATCQQRIAELEKELDELKKIC